MNATTEAAGLTSPGTQTQTATAAVPLPTVPNGKYRLVAELGRGGMATAYLATIQGPGGFNKLVVVKRLHPMHASEPEFLRMFLEEARLAARIDHPNVVHTSEVASDGENFFIAMEYIEGQSLELVNRRARATKDVKEAFPLALQLHVVKETLAGLHFAHELKEFDGTPLALVHRDMSPHNVMVTYEGHVKIVDFGIAKASSSVGDTSTGIIKGKAQYMPAEQFEGRNIDRRADVFAVGVMLWQALTGRKLWSGLTDAEIYRAILAGEIPPPRSVVPDVHPELEGICMRALAVKKEDRYATAADFQAALEAFTNAHAEMRASARELGAFVSALFVDAREKLRAAIEEHLAGRASEELPVLGAPQGSVSGTGIRPSTVDANGAPARLRLGVIAAFALSGFAIVGTLAFGAGDREHARAPAAVATSRVVVAVEPKEARVTLDGVPLSGSPPSGTFPRDGSRRILSADAPGFAARSEAVVLDSSELAIDLALARVAAAESSSPSIAPPSVSVVDARATPAKRAASGFAGRAAPVIPPKSVVAAASGGTSPASAAAAPSLASTPTESEQAPMATPKGRRVRIDKSNPFEEQ